MNFAPLQTKRLNLLPLGKDDLGSLARLVGEDCKIPPIKTQAFLPADAVNLPAWIQACCAHMVAGVGFTFGCRRRVDHAFVGVASLIVGDGTGEINFWFLGSYFGSGYEVEALLRLKELAFDSLYLSQLCAVSDVVNCNTNGILEEVGLCSTHVGSLNSLALGEGNEARFFELKRCSGRNHQMGPMPPVVFVGAVALIDHFNRVLLGQRPANKAMSNLWEFPGGKLEPGETLRASATREIAEELGVEIVPDHLTPFSIASYRYSDFHLLMPLFICRKWSGDCRSMHHRAIRWVPAVELTALPVPPADFELVDELQALLLL